MRKKYEEVGRPLKEYYVAGDCENVLVPRSSALPGGSGAKRGYAMTLSGIFGLMGCLVGVEGFFIGGGSNLASMLPRRFELLGVMLMLGLVPAIAIVLFSAAIVGQLTGWY